MCSDLRNRSFPWTSRKYFQQWWSRVRCSVLWEVKEPCATSVTASTTCNCIWSGKIFNTSNIIISQKYSNCHTYADSRIRKLESMIHWPGKVLQKRWIIVPTVNKPNLTTSFVSEDFATVYTSEFRKWDETEVTNTIAMTYPSTCEAHD